MIIITTFSSPTMWQKYIANLHNTNWKRQEILLTTFIDDCYLLFIIIWPNPECWGIKYFFLLWLGWYGRELRVLRISKLRTAKLSPRKGNVFPLWLTTYRVYWYHYNRKTEIWVFKGNILIRKCYIYKRN